MSELLLDLPISFFEYDHKRNSFANVPSQKTTLRRIVTTRYYQTPIEQIRTEPDKAKQDELKKYQPAFTPVALLNHRKKDTSFAEKIQHQWPMMMGDCDKKDNPGIDMSELKKHIARLPYVLLCAYSVRGGLWFIVRVPDGQSPETLSAHFRYLQKLFSEKFGIKLDSTKGGNPTDLRFVSYDSDPYLNDSATIMTGTYTPPPPKRQAVNYDKSKSVDEGTLLKRLVGFVEKAGEGQRHEHLLKAAKLAGGYIGADRLDEQNAILALETITSEWPQFSKSQKTIRDGIRYGLSSPIYSEERIVPSIPVRHKASSNSLRTTPQVLPARPQPINLDTADVYQRIPVAVRLPESEVVEPVNPSSIGLPLFKIEPEKVPLAARPPINLPKSLLYKWSLFGHPPLWWNKIAAHKALQRCLEAESEPTPPTPPAVIIKPREDQIERLIVEPCNIYPAAWDETSPPDAVPTIKPLSFFEWQRQNPAFSQLGLASLNKQQS